MRIWILIIFTIFLANSRLAFSISDTSIQVRGDTIISLEDIPNLSSLYDKHRNDIEPDSTYKYALLLIERYEKRHDTLGVLDCYHLPDWLTFDADGRMFSGRPDQPGVLNIKLEVKDGHGAGITAMFNITVDETNSISEKKGLEELSVFPNPASSFIRLRTSNLASFSHYSFFDVCGRQIERAPLGSELIDVSKINKGMYLLNLHSEDHIVIRKILIDFSVSISCTKGEVC